MIQIKHLLENYTLCYHVSNMILHINSSDGAYLLVVLPTVEYHYLSSDLPIDMAPPKVNATIHVEYHTICWVMASAAEAETMMAFINAQVTIPECNTLLALGHQQFTMPLKVDNSNAMLGI
jgi:hypothetical protein